MALMLAAAAIGCNCAGAPVAGPPPPDGPPPVPPPHSPIVMLRSSSSSAMVRGCWGAMAVDVIAAVWVVVWVVVVMVNC